MNSRKRRIYAISLRVLLMIPLVAVLCFAPALGSALPAGEDAAVAAGPTRAPSQAAAVYLNGESGDDANDGLTPATAVLTFERAKSLATANQSVTEICIVGLIALEADATWDLSGTNAKLIRDPSYGGDEAALVYIPEGVSLALENITIDGNTSSLAPDQKPGASMIYCAGSITVEDGTVLCNNELIDDGTTYGGAIGNYGAEVSSNPKITINGGEIYGNRASWGGAICGQRTDIVINGGNIHDNEAVHGGGVCAYAEDYVYDQPSGSLVIAGGTIANNTANTGGGIHVDTAEVRMSGGAISGNTAYSNSDGEGKGGGIYLKKGAFTFMDGLVSSNKSEGIAGGIMMDAPAAYKTKSVFTMTGGTVSSNEAVRHAGGIYFEKGFDKPGTSSTGYITGGKIVDNHCTGTGKYGGGGIYVHGDNKSENAHLYLKNVVVTGNTAQDLGGGLGTCPSSNVEIYLQDGGALFGNTSAANKGNDVFILGDANPNNWGTHAGEPNYYITDTMLGNVPYQWKFEDAEAPLNQFFGVNGGSAHSLQLHDGSSILLTAGNAGDKNTEALAKVIISGNTSGTQGGGIASNGDVTIGTEDPQTQVDVAKVWHDGDNKDGLRPDAIDVELYRTIAGSGDDPVYVGYKRITADQDWKTTFYALPQYPHGSPTTPYEYSVRERLTGPYQVEVANASAQAFETDGSAQDTPATNVAMLGCFTITNTLTTSVEGRKTWVDQDNAGGLRPESITIRLLKNGEAVDSETVSAEAGWAYQFTDLAKYEDGTEVAYTIEEDAVAHYQSQVEGYDVTNTLTPESPTPPPYSPATGDGSPWFVFALLGLSLGSLLVSASTGRY